LNDFPSTWLPIQTSPPAVALASGSFPRGTIAAITLAGILAVLILSGLIFYFLFYRTRKRRRRALTESKRRSPKEHEAGVLDIGPEVNKQAELGSRIDLDQRDSSIRNGLSRWIRGAVEGSPGELGLPIRFRHSGSLDEKLPCPLSEVPLDDISDLSHNSSTKRKAKTKNKGKARQLTGRSWSPGRMLDISTRHSRRRSSMQHLSHPAESVSTFLAAEPASPKSVAPPSYAASVSIRDSKSITNGKLKSDPSSNRSVPSVPHSVSPFPGDDRSYPPQKQDHAGTFLLPHGDSHFERDSSMGSSSHGLKPPQTIAMRSLTGVDQGRTVENNMDDNLPTALQHAIGVRTIRHPYASQDEESIEMSPSPQDSLKDAVLTPPNDDDLVEVRDGVFLSVSTPSPFQVTFDTLQIKPASEKSNSAALSYLSASSPTKPSGGLDLTNPDDGTSPDDGTRPMSTSSDVLQGPSNMQFRLTPLSISPISGVPPNSDSEGVTSFLDFTSSREGSLASRSVKTTWSDERQRGQLYPPPVAEKSRWSDTTVPSMQSKWSHNGNNSNSASGNGSSDNSKHFSEPRSLQSSTFPIPIRVSIPSSYGNTMTSGRRSLTSGLTQATSDHLHVHPPFEGLESPTESIPMSAVSELHFRQSVSEENIEFNSRRTTESSLVFVSSHPPLPTRHHDDFMPRPFDPSILVNKVLGLSPTSTTTAGTTGGHAGTAVSSPRRFASSPNLYTSQHITNIRGNPQKFGTDSLGL
jgi:hypothetical protein